MSKIKFAEVEGISCWTICKDVVIVRASDPVPELKGNKLPRIVDYDMMETSEPTWKLWERIKSAIKK